MRNSQTKSANRSNVRDRWSSTDLVSSALLNSCLSRVSAWHVPPNWSRRDWFEEVRADIVAAAWQAVCDFDASRNVPLPAFIYRRMISSALTRFRREWSYAFHSVWQPDQEKRD